MKKANVITGVVFLALSIFAYMQAQKMVGKIMTDALGPGFWPKVLGLMMGVLSLALIVEGLFGKQAEGEKVPIAFGTEGFHRVLKLFAVLIVFGAILYFLGGCTASETKRSLWDLLWEAACLFIWYSVWPCGSLFPWDYSFRKGGFVI